MVRTQQRWLFQKLRGGFLKAIVALTDGKEHPSDVSFSVVSLLCCRFAPGFRKWVQSSRWISSCARSSTGCSVSSPWSGPPWSTWSWPSTAPSSWAKTWRTRWIKCTTPESRNSGARWEWICWPGTTHDRGLLKICCRVKFAVPWL